MPTQTFFSLPEDKRQRIIDLAIEEFASHDYEQASISRVVSRAGIAKGSFYQYFADKRDLYLYLLDMAASEKSEFFKTHPFVDSLDFFDYMRYLFSVGLTFEFSRPALAQIAYRAVYGAGQSSEEATARLQQNSADFFRELIGQAQLAGQIDPDLDPGLVAFLFNQVLIGFGDYLLQRLELDPGSLAAEGGSIMDRPAYWHEIDNLLNILKRGLRPSAA